MQLREPGVCTVDVAAGALLGASNRYTKSLRDLEGVYEDAAAFAALRASIGDTVVYEVTDYKPSLDAGDMILGVTRMLPGKVGREFFLTRGHIHAYFFFNISIFILCMVILGGMGNIWGVIIGGGFLAYLNQEGLGNIGGWLNRHFSDASDRPTSGSRSGARTIDVPLYQFGIFGVILVLVMLFRPEGLIPSSRRKAEFHEGVHDEPLHDVQK